MSSSVLNVQFENITLLKYKLFQRKMSLNCNFEIDILPCLPETSYLQILRKQGARLPILKNLLENNLISFEIGILELVLLYSN